MSQKCINRDSLKQKKFTIEPAPMAGYTDRAFRKVLRKCHAKITWTEMISATALFYKSDKTHEMLKSDGKTIVQLFGKNPAHFEAVIKSGVLDKFAEININMGCPARKITSNGDGCALMKNQTLAFEIISSCVQVAKRPISVKMRLGFDKNIAVQFATMCERAGVSRIIIHGKLGVQGYSGTADMQAIAEVVRAVKIPVIANGDIKNLRDAKNCIAQTNATGVMIGRALIGAPWNISSKKINHKKIMLYHIKHADNILEFRKHLVAYANHLENGKELKKRLALCKSFKEAKLIILRPYL